MSRERWQLPRGPAMLFTIPYDRLTPSRIPWVTFGVAALWLAAFAAMSAGWPDLRWEALSLDAARVEGRALGAHWLLHESFVHLACGVALLLAAGAVLEEAWGRPFFAGFLLLMVLYTSGAHLVTAGEETRPLVGATAALAALLGACIVLQLRDGLHYTAVGWWGRPVHAELRAPAYALLGLWFASEVAMQLADDGVGPTRGASYLGQGTGALLGAAIAGLLRQRGLEARWLRRTPKDAPDPALAEAELAMSQPGASGGEAALRILSPAVQRAPDDAALVTALCRAAAAAREPQAAIPFFLDLIRRRLGAGNRAEAVELWSEHAKALGRPRPDPRVALQLAEALSASGHGLEAARVVRALLDAPRVVSTGMALRLVDIARPVHAGLAIRAAQLALEGGEFAEAKRQRLEEMVRELEALRAERLDPQLDDGPRREDRSIEIAIEDDLRRPPPAATRAAPPPRPPEARDDSPFEMAGDVDLSAPDADPVVGDASAVGHASRSARPGERRPARRDLPPVAPTAARARPMEPPQAQHPEPPQAPEPRPAASPQSAAPASHGAPTPATSATAPASPPAAPSPDAAVHLGLTTAAATSRFSHAKCREVLPVAWEGGRLSLRQGDGAPGWLELARVEAVAAAAVHGLAAKPVVVIDLLMNWSALDDVPLHVLRLRSDRFDPGALLPGAGAGLDAFRAVIEALIAQSGGAPLPDPDHARGRPFAIFRDLQTYEREVLKLDR